MRKKILAVMIAVTAAAGLMACGKSTDSASSNATQAVQSSDYEFESKGISMKVNGKVQDYVKALGDPKGGYYEAKSCAFDGMDKFWYYNNFTIQGYQKNNEDVIYSITLNDDTVKTKEGVKIGDTKDKMESAYGTGKETDGKYVYKSGNTNLSFVLKDNVIQSIEYTLAQ